MTGDPGATRAGATPRVVVVGLDSVSPELAFGVHRERMPFLAGMCARGSFGPLRSTDPPITVPAWVSMTTGKTPAELGIYGFRKRLPGSYRLGLVTPADLEHPRLWDLAAAAGLVCAVVSVPLTYPPPAHPGIFSTSCFLTPSAASPYASPPELKEELEARFGAYIVDVEARGGGDGERLVAECSAMTRQHFAIFRHLIETRAPAFAMIVDLGPDRLHHGALRAALPTHPRHEPGSPLVRAVSDYYAALDAEIARTAAAAGPDATLLVVSDHGVQPLRGSVCVNEWLIREGYLRLLDAPRTPAPLAECRVDWSRTRAFGEGGYHSRIFFNVAGRDPHGVVDPARLDAEREELKARALALRGPSGERLDTRAATPEELYGTRRCERFPPDLTVYWDRLGLRSAGSVGHGALFLAGDDRGSDDANHDFEGIFAIAGRGAPRAGRIDGLRAEDVFSTVAAALGLDAPAGVAGRSIL
ncbi:MAG: alkaline phosphatase family protein [Proteobacteria bacterium]|jgi:predicted AlkP superfamily phosphohydrolase/phosphomutase|nr:alkaline phosphatase family protein [Pseudomonadota bacterium]